MARALHLTAPAFVTVLLVSCATTPSPYRPPDTTPPSASANPVPPPSDKKGVILPTDVKLGSGPGPAAGNTGTAGPAVGPSLGTSSSPN